MNESIVNLNQELQLAIKEFWITRQQNPSSVRAGKHLDGFCKLISRILIELGGIQCETICW